MVPLAKRQKLSPKDDADSSNHSAVDEIDVDEPASDFSQEDSDAEASDSADTEEEIENAKQKKSSKTLKRKHRATDATRFGATLQHLLGTNAPSNLPLSLKPSVARKHNEEKLETKGRKVLLVERKEKEEKGRIKDVIGGWGGESERALRKVAQRGGTSFMCAVCMRCSVLSSSQW